MKCAHLMHPGFRNAQCHNFSPATGLGRVWRVIYLDIYCYCIFLLWHVEKPFCVEFNETLHSLTTNLSSHYTVRVPNLYIEHAVCVTSCLVPPSLIPPASHQSVYLLPPFGMNTSNRDQVCVGTQAAPACLNPSSSVQTS